MKCWHDRFVADIIKAYKEIGNGITELSHFLQNTEDMYDSLQNDEDKTQVEKDIISLSARITELKSVVNIIKTIFEYYDIDINYNKQELKGV